MMKHYWYLYNSHSKLPFFKKKNISVFDWSLENLSRKHTKAILNLTVVIYNQQSWGKQCSRTHSVLLFNISSFIALFVIQTSYCTLCKWPILLILPRNRTKCTLCQLSPQQRKVDLPLQAESSAISYYHRKTLWLPDENITT